MSKSKSKGKNLGATEGVLFKFTQRFLQGFRSILEAGWQQNILYAGMLIFCIFLCLPIFAIIFLAFSAPSVGVSELSQTEIFFHLLSSTLPNYLKNSLLLMLMVGILALVLGVSAAWLLTGYSFTARKFFTWALALPLAIPTYIFAYLYGDFLDYSGPLQSFIRDLGGFTRPSDYFFPELRSLPGAALMLALALYPYIYLFARKAFLEYSPSLAMARELMGISGLKGFFKTSLGMARPALGIGLSLVLMETISDFGVVEYFAINTLSLGMYNLWLNMGNLAGAAQTALLTLFIVVSLSYLERSSRMRQSHAQKEGSFYSPPLKKLSAVKQLLVLIYLGSIFFIAFLLPSGLILYHSLKNFSSLINENFIAYTRNSMVLALLAASVALLISISMAYAQRLNKKGFFTKIVNEIMSLGYAIPGTILAIGILVPFTTIDSFISDISEAMGGGRLGLLLSGSGFSLVFAYVLRFIIIPQGAISSGLGRIHENLDNSAALMGFSKKQTLSKLHLPLLKKSLFTGFLILFIESLKELSATIILRPFDFETLSTYIYAYASDERIEEASLACLLLIGLGLLPTVIIMRSLNTERTLY